MSFLRSGMGLQSYKIACLKLKLKLLTIYHIKPSPTFHDKNPGTAQNPGAFQDGNIFRLPRKPRFLERISLPASW